MNNREIAAALDEVADLLEFQGANPFRVRAYRNGARKVKDAAASLAAVVQESGAGELTKIDGVGKDLAEKIAELATEGSLAMLEELRSEVPEGVLKLMRVPGLGPKKAAAVHKQLGVATLDQLRAACEAEKVRELKGFGKKTEEAILAGVDLAERAGSRTRWADADAVVERLLAHMDACDAVHRREPAGSYRRGKETVGDLDLLVDVGAATDGDRAMDAEAVAAVMDRFGDLEGVADVIARGDTKMSVRLESDLQIDLRCVPSESFGAALQYFTGSKEHNVEVRGRAKARGLRVNEWGVFREDPSGELGERVAGDAEEAVYAALDLPAFPPELRENRDEFAAVDAGHDLPNLVELADLRGDLHLHTSATDGTATIREMVAAARDAGLDYLAVTDHSKRVTMAHGLDADRLREQWREVDRVNEELADSGIDFRVLKGIECDILEAGPMDLPDDVLAEADWVIASLHYGQQQPRTQIMDRLLGAVAHPSVAIVAHPTGRLIGRRAPYDVAVDELIAAAAEHGKMLELNANPMRLDLDDAQCAAAKAAGVPIVISSDAHSPGGFAVLRYGVLQARRAGLTVDDVANTAGVDRFLSDAPADV
ncbi:MAG: DNA polymerase/3'-5' exonuclease PolX [Planctomycetota bacterium]